MLKSFLALAVALLTAESSFGYALEGPSWTRDRTVAVQLSLGSPRTLSDGYASFNESALAAISSWGPYLAHLKLAPRLKSPVKPVEDDDEMSFAFSSTVFGDSFGGDTLAVTTLNSRGNVMEETDTLFNTAYIWDSYSGNLRPNVTDFHRVAIHEFGHTLGLDHPDEAGQHVVAIMNSVISNVDRQQPDDIAGVEHLYNTGPAYQSAVDGPVLANISTRAFVGTGDNVLIGGFIIQGSEPATVIVRAIGFSLAAQGFSDALPDPTITVYDSNHNQVGYDDDWFVSSGASNIASYRLDPPNSIESALLLTLQPGAYTAVVQSYSDSNEPAEGGIGLFELYDLHKTAGRAGNLSTRGQVLDDNNVLIGGFIIGGSENKPIIVRALGPSLGAAGVQGALSDPLLELHDGNGNLLQENDNWGSGANAQTIAAEGFAPKNAKESAVTATLPPGAYTAIVRGVNGATGIALVEVYDLSPVP
ncbi:MAG TPA: matrixin family metalloprotease [Chthoniobacterales bacterium]|jgi:hypothetical protein